AQRALAAQFAGIPDGARLFAELMATMRAALATALHDAFLMSALVAACALATSLLLREIPLRKRQATPALEETGKALAITGAGEVAVLPAGSEPRLSVAPLLRQPSGD